MRESFGALIHQLQAGDVVLALGLLLLASWGISGVLGRLQAGPLGRLARGWRGFAWQLAALLGLEQAYEVTRGQIPHETDIAIMNAYRVLDFEWSHGFFIESRVERFFLQFHLIMTATDLFYIVGHVGATLGVLAWVYFAHRERFPYIRGLLMLTTAIALIVFYLFPTAPPRLLANYGFVDPLVLNKLTGPGGSQPTSYTYNPYAAMPSLHVGYALVTAVAVVTLARRWWVRWLGGLYPGAMAVVVIISGNHWVLDVLGAVVTVALSAALLRLRLWGLARLRLRYDTWQERASLNLLRERSV